MTRRVLVSVISVQPAEHLVKQIYCLDPVPYPINRIKVQRALTVPGTRLKG